ncbi:hypothetical protein ACSDQ9_09915 [Aestuariimicrobium soli]|uniref:hypothetical protein n=1 Tax=Aestuariimicrobium soli TaxID=2035834 RepID=UPI003EB8C7A4
MSSRVLSVRTMLVAGAAAALLAGCGQAPSAAFTVGDQTVSISQLDTAARDCLPAFPNDSEADVRSVVANGLYGAAVSRVLSASGTTVAESDVDASLDSLGTAQLTGECRDALKGVLRARLLTEKLGADKTAELLKNVEVSVNPAVGGVNSSKTEIVARSGSMSSLGRVFGSSTGQ